VGVVVGNYVFRWTITNGACTSYSDVEISINQIPTPANVGPTQFLCNLTSTTLTGNTPLVGTGTWTQIGVLPNLAVITSPNQPNSTVTGLIPGSYQFRWTIVNGICTSSADLIVTVYGLPTTANAGPTQDHCGPVLPATSVTVTMAANTPVVGTGAWTKISGPGTQTITNTASPTTTITGLIYGTYVFRWSITNGTCPPSTSDVTININHCGPITFNETTYLCKGTSTSGNVLANGDYSPEGRPLTVNTTPVVLPAHGSFTVLANGNYTYTPVVTYVGTDKAVVSVCDNASYCTNDTIFINVVDAVTANAGPDQVLCNQSSTFLTGNYPPTGSSGNWTFVSGPITVTPTPANSPMASVTGLIPSTTPYIFRYTITSTFPGASCTSFDDVQVLNYNYPTLPYAGPDQQLCLSGGPSTSTTLTGNTPVYGTGIWQQKSGPSTAVIATPSNPTTSVTNLIAGTYTFSWGIYNGVCDTLKDYVDVVVNTPATANAGSNATICQGSTYTLSTSTATNYTSLLWTTSGTGIFNNSTTLHPIYTPSASDITAGTVTLTLTAYSTSPCANATSSMVLTIGKSPTASAGPNGSVCQGTAYTVSGASATNYSSTRTRNIDRGNHTYPDLYSYCRANRFGNSHPDRKSEFRMFHTGNFSNDVDDHRFSNSLCRHECYHMRKLDLYLKCLHSHKLYESGLDNFR
jgi:hypothetical protein